ncbi:malate transporter [Vibrio cholerae]|uniref:malate transporter n=1 Tax=Vibrio cholerae TaxID=666 RepID=UPI0039670D0C
MANKLIYALLPLSLWASFSGAEEKVEGYIGLAADFYQESSPNSVCCDHFAATMILAPRMSWWNEQGWAVNFTPYMEYEAPSEQGFINLREANLTYAAESTEWLIGYGLVYWGVTEVYQPVNIVNQYDGRIALGYEEKMGQPMLQMRWLPEWGETQFLILPFHQTRTWREPNQRRALTKPVSSDALHPDGEQPLDLASRVNFWQDELDIALSAFYGNSREPLLIETASEWQQSYAKIFQFGTELQWTKDDLLVKGEGTLKSGEGSTYGTLVAGFEYSLYGFSFSQGQLGLIAEYTWDNRDTSAPATIYDNDLFLGLRWQANDVSDTELLLSGLFDLDDASQIYKLTASGRINHHWRWVAESYYLSAMANNEPMAYLSSESYLSIKAEFYF